MRYENVVVINPYFGVTHIKERGIIKYRTSIHINGNYLIGKYDTVEKAAIAYNKAIDLAKEYGIKKDYQENYIETMSPKEYADLYLNIKISPKYIAYLKGLPN